MWVLVVDSRSPVPVYQQIVDQIRSRVLEGDLAPGTPLPSVRQLASELGVNPNTVAKAYLLLEREGVIRTVRRRGVFVAESSGQATGRVDEARLEEAARRVLREAANLGIDVEELLDAVTRRLPGGSAKGTRKGGRSR